MSSCECHPGFKPSKNCFVIKNPTTQLVLDSTDDNEVKVQNFTGCPLQLWRVEEAGDGQVMLINVDTGKVLDVLGGISSCAKLTTSEKNGGKGQLWHINHRGKNIMTSGNMAVDIDKGCCTAGNAVIIYPKNNKSNQEFSLEYV